MSVAVRVATAKYRKQFECILMAEWVCDSWYTHETEYCMAAKECIRSALQHRQSIKKRKKYKKWKKYKNSHRNNKPKFSFVVSFKIRIGNSISVSYTWGYTVS